MLSETQSEWITLPETLYHTLSQISFAHLDITLFSIPAVIAFTTIITILWAEKLPSLPFHIHRYRFLIGKEKVSRWQRELVAKNIDDTLKKTLSHQGELLEYLGQEPMSQQAEQALEPHIEEYVDEIMSADFSIVWENLPPFLKRRAYQRAKEGLPNFIDNIIEDISEQSNQLLNYEQMCSELLEQHPLQIEAFFKPSRFYRTKDIIQRSLSMALGLSIPIMFYSGFSTHADTAYGTAIVILLELAAVAASIYMTLLSIYKPISPIFKWRLTIHNLLTFNFKPVIHQHAELIAFQILKLDQIVRHLFKGPNIPATQKIIRKHLHPLIETFFTKMVIQIFFGISGFLRLKKKATEKIALLADYPFEDRTFQADRSQLLQKLLLERLSGLPSSDIALLMRPYLQYLRVKTLLCVAATGSVMASIQWYIFT